MKYFSDPILGLQLWATPLFFDSTGKRTSCYAEMHRQSNDPKKWVFKFSENNKWSDGSPMTPQELTRMFSEAVASSQKSQPNSHIIGLRTIGSNQVELTLDTFDRSVAESLSSPWMLLIDEKNPTKEVRWSDPSVRFSGPYRVRRYNGQTIDLEANPYFPEKCRSPLLPVHAQFGVTLEASLQMLESREANLSVIRGAAPPASDMEKLRDRGVRILYSSPTLIDGFYFGRHAKNLSGHNRRYLLRALWEAAGKAPGMLPSYLTGNMGLAPWKQALEKLPQELMGPVSLEVFVMKSLELSPTFIEGLAALKKIVPNISVRVYDFNSPADPITVRRTQGDFDLLFFNFGGHRDTLSYLSALNLMIQADAGPIQAFAGLERTSRLGTLQRLAKFLEIERSNLAFPFVIPLRQVESIQLLGPDLEIIDSSTSVFGIQFWRIQ